MFVDVNANQSLHIVPDTPIEMDAVVLPEPPPRLVPAQPPWHLVCSNCLRQLELATIVLAILWWCGVSVFALEFVWSTRDFVLPTSMAGMNIMLGVLVATTTGLWEFINCTMLESGFVHYHVNPLLTETFYIASASAIFGSALVDSMFHSAPLACTASGAFCFVRASIIALVFLLVLHYATGAWRRYLRQRKINAARRTD
jgi:hypothetical protein